MNNLDLITFDENGQGVVDWESLELLTSSKFVERVREFLPFPDSEVVSISESDYYVQVIVYDSGVFTTLTWGKKFYSFNVTNLTMTQLKFFYAFAAKKGRV